MQLDEFIKTTLVSVVKGVRQANEETKEFRQNSIKDSPLFVVHRAIKGHDAGKIFFDVAVTVNEETTGKGSGGIKIAGIGVGGESGTSLLTGNQSRIKFEVDVSEIVF